MQFCIQNWLLFEHRINKECFGSYFLLLFLSLVNVFVFNKNGQRLFFYHVSVV